MSARPMRLELYRSHGFVDRRGCGDPNCQITDLWRWRIRATNGRILADSAEAYGRLRDCAHGAVLATGLNLDGGVKPGDDLIRLRIQTDGRRSTWRVTVTK